MNLKHPYRKRPVRFVRIANLNGWKITVYSISASRERPDIEIIEEGLVVASQQLPTPAVYTEPQDREHSISINRYGVAVLIVHEAQEGLFVLVSWWAGENMLQHHVYFSSFDQPFDFEYISPSGIVACVWEMAVLAFEREAWVENVLANPSGPNVEKYLSSQFSTDV